MFSAVSARLVVPCRTCVSSVGAGAGVRAVGATRSVVSVRIRSGSPTSYTRGLEQFKRRVTAEGVEKELQKKRFYMKPNIRRRLNVENTRYFKARKEVIAEYMRLVRRGQVEKIPDSKF